MSIFTDRLRELMKEHRITAVMLVNEGIISKNNISNWEKGITPQRATVIALSNRFGVSVDYLLGNTDDKRTAPEHISEADLTEEEATILHLLRNAPQYAKDAARNLLESAERAASDRDASEEGK